MTGRAGVAVRLRGLLDEHRKPPDRLRADDHVRDAARSPENGRAFLLRHTPGHRHDRAVTVRPLDLRQLPEARVQLLLGALAHAAGVDDDHVGVHGILRRLEAGLLQQPGHALGVVHVHLAAERFDQVFTRHMLG